MIGRIRAIYGPGWPWVVVLYVCLAVICGYVSWSRVVIDANGVVFTNQNSVDFAVNSRSSQPEGLATWPQMRSRLLLPVIIVGAYDYLGIPYNITHDALRLLFIILAAIAFHWHLRTWFSPLESLTGTVLVLATVTITFNNWFPVLTDIPELLAMTVCTALLIRRRWILMLVALFLYTLNRETALTFVFVASAWLWDWKRSTTHVLAIAALIVLTWGTAYYIARTASNIDSGSFFLQEGTPGGSTRGVLTQATGLINEIWERRRASWVSLLTNPHPYNVNWAPFLVLNIFWILPLAYWRAVPDRLRRLYLSGLAVGFPMFLLAGVLNETGRLMIPLYPLLLPAGLFVLYRRVLTTDPALFEPAQL